jgi:hypothetical protein
MTSGGRSGIILLNADGTYNPSLPFNASGVGSFPVLDFEILPDGKLICVGDFGSYNGYSIGRIVRLNPDGTRDLTFNPPAFGFQNYVYEVIVQGSKYICIGFFNAYGLQPVERMARINPDGSLDTTFFTGDFAGGSEDQIIHLYQITGNTNDAGYFFVGGFFDSYDGVLTNNIVKLDRNGYAVDCDPILITPTPTNTSTPTQTPTNTETPTQTQTQTNTPSPTCACLKYELSTSFTNPVYTYTGCDGIVRNIQIGFFSTFDICALSAPTGGFSTFLGCCDVVPTPPPTNTQTRTPTPTPTNTRTPTATPTQTQTSTPQVSPTSTQTPTTTSTPTMTPTQTITPTCATFTTQYLRVRLLGCSNFDLGLFDNPDFTGNANAICDYVVSGTAYGDLGTVYTGTETIQFNDHIHTFNLNPVLLPGECVSGFTVNSITPECPCVNVIYQTITPTPTPTNTSTPTSTQTQTPSPTSETIPSPTPTNTSTSTNTPTPSITPPSDNCVCYEYENTGDPEGVNAISWLDCNNQFQQIDNIPYETGGYFCAILGSVTETEGIIYSQVDESFCGGCFPSPSPTPTNTQTPTGTSSVSPSPTPTTTPTPTGEPGPECIEVIAEVTAPTPQTGSNNVYGAKVSLSPFPVDEDVVVDGYLQNDDTLDTYTFTLTILGGTEYVETSGYPLVTGPATTASIFITSITPTSVTYNGVLTPICGL